MNYDIIIIGAGSGGLNIAGFMNKAGFKVLLIDKSEKNIGGDCLNFGCVPSKALIHLSKIVHQGKEAKRFGLNVKGEVNMKKVKDYIRQKQGVIREHENADHFRKEGIDVELGEASFASKNSIEINGQEHKAKNIVIATGSRPRKLNTPGIEKIDYLTNENIFDLEKLPKRLLIVGGGPVGIELGQAFNRLGSIVTVVQRGNHFLPKEKKEITDLLLAKLKGEGMQFYFDTTPKEFKKNELVTEEGSSIKFDKVLVSVGREPEFASLRPEKAGIKVDNGKIRVNNKLQTTNKKVYLCGDIAGGPKFTHAAELHAGVIIQNLLSPVGKKLTYDNFSWVTFTDPEIATFGLVEETLKQRKINYEKFEYDLCDDDRAIVDDFRNGKIILYISKGKIMGGTLLAENAGELMQELVLANSSKLDIKNIFNKIYAYPTASRINKKVISNFFSKRLTKRTKTILRWLYG